MSDDSKPYSEFALIDLLDAFASNAPVPGGGSASALSGALGVSLLIMAASLPKSRTGAPEEAADLAEAAARLRPLRDTLVALIDDDSDAYQAVMKAMKLPKDSPDEKAARTDALQSALKDATDVPLDVMRAGQQALAGGVIVARNAYRVAASDVAMGIELLGASVRGAALSIDGNLSGINGLRRTPRAWPPNWSSWPPTARAMRIRRSAPSTERRDLVADRVVPRIFESWKHFDVDVVGHLERRRHALSTHLEPFRGHRKVELGRPFQIVLADLLHGGLR